VALDKSDLELLGSFIDERISGIIGDVEKAREEKAVQNAERNRAAVVGTPDVPADAGPEFYVHLADGSVVTTHDSSSTHLPGADGEPVAVIGRFQKGA